MAVIIDRKKRIFTLQTKNTSYQMKVDERNVLIHIYYGARIGADDLSQLVFHCGRGLPDHSPESEKYRWESGVYAPF